MGVYVDQPMARGGKFNNYCHMYADTVEELHVFAVRLGLKRAWFQDKSDHPHYDISLNKRRIALRIGTIEVTPSHTVQWMQSNRDVRNAVKGYEHE